MARGFYSERGIGGPADPMLRRRPRVLVERTHSYNGRVPGAEAVLEAASPPAERKRIRVLHLITSLDRGGAENHLLALMTHANLAELEFETAVLCGDGELV